MFVSVICESWHLTDVREALELLHHFTKRGWGSCAYETSLTSPLFIEVPVVFQKIERSVMYRFCLCFYDFSNRFWNCCRSVVYFAIYFIVYAFSLQISLDLILIRVTRCFWCTLYYPIKLYLNNNLMYTPSCPSYSFSHHKIT